MWPDGLFPALEALKDATRAPHMEAHMKNRFRFLGLAAPQRRAAIDHQLDRKTNPQGVADFIRRHRDGLSKISPREAAKHLSAIDFFSVISAKPEITGAWSAENEYV